jgi:hypothetical protein
MILGREESLPQPPLSLSFGMFEPMAQTRRIRKRGVIKGILPL